ncbi:hypothetical protein DITRI_Ditri18aG0038500 [Diplodiscus trichospermus]
MEGLVIQYEEGDEESFAMSRFIAIGKVISEKSLNRNGVLKILRGIWPKEIAPCIREVGHNLYGVLFIPKDHVRRAIEKRPWSVMGCSLALQE